MSDPTTCPDWCNWANPDHWHDWSANGMPVDGEPPRPPCSHCPPGCRSCEPDDCECYSHQDWPDTRFDAVLAARLTRCIDGPGCDGRSHGIDCNSQLYAPTTETGETR